MVLVMLLSLTSVYSQSTVTCGICNGYKALRCSGCNGGGIVYSQVWNPYYGCYQTVQQYCGYCGGRGYVTDVAVMGIWLSTISLHSKVIVRCYMTQVASALIVHQRPIGDMTMATTAT